MTYRLFPQEIYGFILITFSHIPFHEYPKLSQMFYLLSIQTLCLQLSAENLSPLLIFSLNETISVNLHQLSNALPTSQSTSIPEVTPGPLVLSSSSSALYPPSPSPCIQNVSLSASYSFCCSSTLSFPLPPLSL